ncbi:hypothetical protein GUITHDRAFT_137172 [Guillardia theta CCMP2712]|uniref:Tyrosine-protein kinase ephrin type A/B receptor-like domain-containing protein n=1 Tax=Guillardia theta (strain CCMP2712) TaxID=905079 RepID=L1JH28_GUITC|nr:hypothetical protein GUITHDRAFT_137172 [Guillardia theta CCMP2712]EKX47786.1 hypothetical protein GUITHDRAFT_137172 [Guillardia theta CCMP2712]|eukprot:XP_005834766.1 hypothetical protein GUITHDRAFT_137172 [Guillardia theta CCMP2712]
MSAPLLLRSLRLPRLLLLLLPRLLLLLLPRLLLLLPLLLFILLHLPLLRPPLLPFSFPLTAALSLFSRSSCSASPLRLHLPLALRLCLGLCLLAASSTVDAQALNQTVTGQQDRMLLVALDSSPSWSSWTILSLPLHGELFVPVKGTGTYEGNLTLGPKVQSPGTLLPSNLVFFLPFPSEFSCSICDPTGVVCTICVPYANFAFQVLDGSGSPRRGEVNIIVKQNSDLPFAGGAGGGIYFDGYDDFAYVSLDPLPTSSLTITMWLKSMRRRRLQTVFGLFSSRGRELEVNDVTDLRVYRRNEVSASRLIDISDGQWHHLALSWTASSGQLDLYVDGVLRLTDQLAAGEELLGTGELFLGQRPICGSQDKRSVLSSERLSVLSQTASIRQPDGRVTTSCASDEPAPGCDYFLPQQLLETVVATQDANDILRRSSVPSAPSVDPGAWKCAYTDHVCVHGSPTVMDAFACTCAPGCMEPRFAFAGFLDEIRMYSHAKTEKMLSLDMWFVIGAKKDGLSLGRSPIHWEGLFLYMNFDSNGKAMDGGLATEPNVITDYSATLSLGGDLVISRPQRMGSTAPIFGSYLPLSIPMNGVSMNLLKIPIYGADVSISVVRCRIKDPIPVFGKLYTAEYDPRVGFGSGIPIVLGNTILQLFSNVESKHGYETCGPSGCTRDGYYLFYTGDRTASARIDELAVEISSSPFLDDKGNPIPVISALSSLLLFSRQLPYPVTWSEEVVENQARVAYLPYITVTDESLEAFVASLPAKGELFHLIEIKCDDVDGFTQPGSCSDIQAVNLLCGSEQAYSDLVIRNSRGDASWSIVTIEDELFAANCTDLTQVNGRRVVRGVNDSAMICKTFINETTRCLVSPMTTCSCVYPSGFTCFLSIYANYLLPLSSYSLMPKRSYVTLATLFERTKLLKWMLTIGCPVGMTLRLLPPPLFLIKRAGEEAMEIAAALGNLNLLQLLLQFGSSPTQRAISAAWKRMRVDVAHYLEELSRAISSSSSFGQNQSRCFVKGPMFDLQVSSIPSKVADVELRLLYVPEPFDISPALTANFRLTRPGSFQLTDSFLSSATFRILPQRNYPMSSGVTANLSSSETLQVLQLSLIKVEEGETRARVLSFPQHGDLYNLLPVYGADGNISGSFLGPRVVAAEQQQEQLPVSVLNLTNGTLTERRGEGWTGRLFYPPIPSCRCRHKVVGVQLVNGQERPQVRTESQCEEAEAFSSMCGDRGTDAAMFRYEQKVFPEELSIQSWMPDSTFLRVLALHPPWEEVKYSLLRSQSSLLSNEFEAAGGGGEARREEATVTKEREESWLLQGCSNQWEELWRGYAIDVRASPGAATLDPPLPPPSFPTDSILIQVCGLQHRGIGMADGGNVLEGLRVVRLKGTAGDLPEGMVTHPLQLVGYRRRNDGKEDGQDEFTFSAYDSKRLASSSNVSLSLPVAQADGGKIQQEVLVRGSVPARVPVRVLDQSLFPLSLQLVVLTTRPTRGTLQAMEGYRFLPLQRVTCGSSSLLGEVYESSTQTASPPLPAFLYSAPSEAGGKDFDRFEYIVCPSSRSSPLLFVSPPRRTVRISVLCDANKFWAASSCKICPPGSSKPADQLIPQLGLYSLTWHLNCSSCPAGTFRDSLTSSCQPCPPGSFAFLPGSSSCSPCPPGTFNPQQGSTTCSSCPPGTYGGQPGLLECRDCGAFSFGPVSGLTSCLKCPELTVTNNMRATKKSQCECQGDAYHKQGRVGEACWSCPAGMYCSGSTLPPVVRTGWWSSSEIYPDPLTVFASPCNFRSVRGVCRGYPEVDNQSSLQQCLFHPFPSYCPAGLWPNISGLPGDGLGGNYDFYYGSTRLDEERRTGVNQSSLLGKLANKSRLYLDAAHCAVGYTGRYLIWFSVVVFIFILLANVAISDSHLGRIVLSLGQAIQMSFFLELHLLSLLQISWPPHLKLFLSFFSFFNFK